MEDRAFCTEREQMSTQDWMVGTKFTMNVPLRKATFLRCIDMIFFFVIIIVHSKNYLQRRVENNSSQTYNIENAEAGSQQLFKEIYEL